MTAGMLCGGGCISSYRNREQDPIKGDFLCREKWGTREKREWRRRWRQWMHHHPLTLYIRCKHSTLNESMIGHNKQVLSGVTCHHVLFYCIAKSVLEGAAASPHPPPPRQITLMDFSGANMKNNVFFIDKFTFALVLSLWLSIHI